MTLRTYVIELRTDHDDPEKDSICIESMRQAAKHAFTQASLLADKRKPQIAFRSGDLFEREAEIDLAEDIG